MSRPTYSIRFPLVKERTKLRRGPRFRLVVDKSGLFGARSCAAGMVNCAMNYRRESSDERPSYRSDSFHQACLKLARLNMRIMSLWARVFAGHLEAEDPRIVAATDATKEICRQMHRETEAYLASA